MEAHPEDGTSSSDQQPAVPALSLAASSSGRVSGKNWKSQKSATARSHLQEGVKTKSWADRMEKTTRQAAVKKLEKQLKEEKQAEITRRKEITLERKKRAEEKTRLEEMKAKLSAKKIARMRRRAGRTKKING